MIALIRTRAALVGMYARAFVILLFTVPFAVIEVSRGLVALDFLVFGPMAVLLVLCFRRGVRIDERGLVLVVPWRVRRIAWEDVEGMRMGRAVAFLSSGKVITRGGRAIGLPGIETVSRRPREPVELERIRSAWRSARGRSS